MAVFHNKVKGFCEEKEEEKKKKKERKEAFKQETSLDRERTV